LATIALFLSTTLAFLYYGGVYAFAEPKAAEVGLDAKILGAILSASSLLAIPGSVLAGALGTRYGRSAPLIGVMVIAALSYYLVLGATSAFELFAGLVIYGVMQMFLNTYIYGTGAALDATGRVAAALQGYALLPYAFGSGVLASLSHGEALTTLAVPSVVFQIIAIAIILPVALWLDLRNRRLVQPTQVQPGE
jgi:MFS family permease